MFGRGLLLAAVLVAAVAIPYFMMNDGLDPGQRIAGLWNSMFHTDDDLPRYGNPLPSASPIPPRGSANRTSSPWRNAPSALNTAPVRAKSAPPTGAQATSAAYPGIDQRSAATVPGGEAEAADNAAANRIGPYVRHVGELFRFDITPDWVVQNWPRVTSQLADFSYTGLRVPVVSGTSMQDLAGSLTYYFDSQQQLQRITFLGTTGDPTPLVQLATSQLEMQPQAALNGRCFVARSDDVATDILRVRHVAIATDDRPHQRYKIAMELNRRGNSQGLSAVNARQLEHERKIIETSRSTAPTP